MFSKQIIIFDEVCDKVKKCIVTQFAGCILTLDPMFICLELMHKAKIIIEVLATIMVSWYSNFACRSSTGKIPSLAFTALFL